MPFGQYKAKLVFNGGADNPTVQTIIDSISTHGMGAYGYEGTGNWASGGASALTDTYYLVDFNTGAEIQVLTRDGTYSAFFPIPGSSHFWRIAVVAFPPGLFEIAIEMWDDDIGTNPINVACELDIAINNGTNPVPSPPTGLTGTRDFADVNLIWSASPDPNVTGYHIYRDGVDIATGTTTTYDDTTSDPTVQHTYYIKAVNGAGESAQSNTYTAVPFTTPPISPSDEGAGPTVKYGSGGEGRTGLGINLSATRI